MLSISENTVFVENVLFNCKITPWRWKEASNAFLLGVGLIPGIALLYLQLYRVTGDQTYLLRSLDYVKRTLRNLSGRRVTFLCGDAGPLAVGAVIYHKLKSECESQECITKWVWKIGNVSKCFVTELLSKDGQQLADFLIDNCKQISLKSEIC